MEQGTHQQGSDPAHVWGCGEGRVEDRLYLMAITDQELLLSGSGSGFLKQMRVFQKPEVLS